MCAGVACRSILRVLWLLVVLLSFFDMFQTASAQSLTIEQIRTNLVSNPPNSQNRELRKQTIQALDQTLMDDAVRTSSSVFDFYTSMIQKVKTEIRDTVKEGAVVWMMYNDGFIVKTSDCVFAFDLIDGYSLWPFQLPPEVINQIKVLFISHSHGDHFSVPIVNQVKANGGFVVVPSENSYIGNVPLAPNESVTLSGLRITAHPGLHNVPLRMYEVTCTKGLKFFHTGDEQTSTDLPAVGKLDVLLLDAWINESGSSYAIRGMTKSLDRMKPNIMIPGHIHELGHAGPTHAATYDWALTVADTYTSTDVRVMAWGERLVVANGVVTNVEGSKEGLPTDFVLSQNYPNPFNPTTTFDLRLPISCHVTIKVFDLLGQELGVLVDDLKTAGIYSVRWDASTLPSGVYVCRLFAENHVLARKMVLLK
jgi:L-ascorbate metabolism protein UlaG (beta-lactamase superfamily)